MEKKGAKPLSCGAVKKKVGFKDRVIQKVSLSRDERRRLTKLLNKNELYRADTWKKGVEE